jgi:hypothetical protein
MKVYALATLVVSSQALLISKTTGKIRRSGELESSHMQVFSTGKFHVIEKHHGPAACAYETERLDCKKVSSCTYVDSATGNAVKSACPLVPKGSWTKISSKSCMCVKHAPIPKCSGGQVYASCANACTATCTNLHPVCSSTCVRRCACPSTQPLWDVQMKQCVERNTCQAAMLEGNNGMCHENEKTENDSQWTEKFGCGKQLKFGWWFEHGADAEGTVSKTFSALTENGARMSVAEAKSVCDKMGTLCDAFVFSETDIKILSTITAKHKLADAARNNNGLYYKPVCPTPLHPADGAYEVVGGGVGAIARVRCGPGFQLVGSAKRTCRLNGTWGGSDPYCERNKCLDPPPIHQNGKVLMENGIATYSCDPGFALEGSRERTCTNGVWSGMQPKCELSCDKTGIHKPPQHGKIDPSQEDLAHKLSGVANSVIQYSCNSGYVVSGTKPYSTCTVKAATVAPSWSEPTYECKPVECPEPQQIAHASLSDNGPDFYGETGDVDYPVGRIAKYQCHTGYQMLGPQISTCQGNGKWSAVPICVKFFQCKHTKCKMHGHSVQLMLRQNNGPGKSMHVEHGNGDDHDRPLGATGSIAPEKLEKMSHRCRYDPNAGVDGEGACECICWHQDDLIQQQHAISGRNGVRLDLAGDGFRQQQAV